MIDDFVRGGDSSSRQAPLTRPREAPYTRCMTTTQTATVKVFLAAFRGLSKSQRQVFLDELLREKAYREDLLDLAVVEARRHESARPYRQYLAERPGHRVS